MAIIKQFFNRLFQLILLATSISLPLFSDPGAFSNSEFPRHSFPLELKDWGDILVFLYTHGDAATRKHADEYMVADISRYAYKEAPEHQIIVVGVEQSQGGRKLLRIERDTGVKDVMLNQSIIAGPALQDSSPPGPTKITSTQRPGIGFEVSHPSISIYSSAGLPGVNESNSFVDTVQTTFESDIRNYNLVDSIKASNFKLYQFALLVAEVQSYTLQMSNEQSQQEGRACAFFTGLVMRAAADALGSGVTESVSASAALGIDPENLKQIQAAYQRRRKLIDRQIATATPATRGQRPRSWQFKTQDIEHAEYVQSV